MVILVYEMVGLGWTQDSTTLPYHQFFWNNRVRHEFQATSIQTKQMPPNRDFGGSSGAHTHA